MNIKLKKIYYGGYLYRITTKYVTYSIYRYSYIYSFVASGILLLSKYSSLKIDTLQKIYKRYLIRDDQYIGVLCNILKIKPYSINKYYVREKIKSDFIRFEYLLFYHTNHIKELLYFYNKFLIK